MQPFDELVWNMPWKRQGLVKVGGDSGRSESAWRGQRYANSTIRRSKRSIDSQSIFRGCSVATWEESMQRRVY